MVAPGDGLDRHDADLGAADRSAAPQIIGERQRQRGEIMFAPGQHGMLLLPAETRMKRLVSLALT
jgi:hypothetical protein